VVPGDLILIQIRINSIQPKFNFTMKLKFIFLIYLLCFYVSFSFAQATRLKYVGFETGMTFIGSTISNVDYIRGSIPAYTDGYSASNLSSTCYKSFAGVKFEIFSLNDRLGFSAGLRYSRINSSVGKNSYWTDNVNYFYWLYLQNGVNTEYLKVREINQKSDYIGIPLEVRYFPARRPHLFRVYFKVGAEVNYLLHNQKDIVFYDNAMNIYKGDLMAKVETPKTFYSSVYGGGGIRLGRELKPSLSFEACLPYLFLTSQSSGLVNPNSGGGFQINFQIPTN